RRLPSSPSRAICPSLIPTPGPKPGGNSHVVPRPSFRKREPPPLRAAEDLSSKMGFIVAVAPSAATPNSAGIRKAASPPAGPAATAGVHGGGGGPLFPAAEESGKRGSVPETPPHRSGGVAWCGIKGAVVRERGWLRSLYREAVAQPSPGSVAPPWDR